jgi:lipid A 4'-phosphatase
MKKTVFIDFAVPVFIAIILTSLIVLTNADIEIEKLLYSPEKGWFMGRNMPWYFLYNYGNIPAILLSAAGLVILVLGFFRQQLLPYRKISLFLVIFMILGPGLLVNTVFKEHWGRPRPADIVNFGGTETFRQIWEKGQPEQGKSFPSGHAAVGFFLFSPFFFLRKTSRSSAFLFLGLGIFYGTFMGAGRMIQGGHFLSDVLWSGVFTYLTGLILYYIFRFDEEIK